jgi:hypothetical protein
MTVQRLQAVIIIILLVVCVGIGFSLYQRNNDIASIHNSIGTLSDEVRQTAKNKTSGASAAVTEADIKSAHAMLETCGQTPLRKDVSSSERMDAILPYLQVGKKFSALIDDGYELVHACVDDSKDPRILFLAVKHLPNFAGNVAFGIVSEADPKAATMVTMRDTLNLVNDASPSTCEITGNGAAPASQFLVRCDNADTAISHGFALDFLKSTSVDAYKCGTAQDGTCEVLNADVFAANKDFFDDEALKNLSQ